MKKLFVLFAALVVGFANTSIAKTLDMALPYGDGTHQTQVAKEFAAEITRNTYGETTIKAHAGGSLIKHPEIHRAVKSGQVPIGEVFIGRLGNIAPVFKLDNLPFVATNFDDAEKLYKASKKVLAAELKKDGLILLYSSPWPAQDLYSNTYIRSLKDLQGLKMRSYSPTTSKLATLMSTTPVNIPFSDVAQAFTTNTIDAMITSPSTGVNSQSWDYIKYLNTVSAWIPKNMVFINNRAFSRLDNNTQNIIMQAAANAEKRGWALGKKLAIEHTDILRDNGMIVTKPTTQLTKELNKIGDVMLKDWLQESGQVGREIINSYQSM